MFKDIIEKEIKKEVKIVKRFSGGMSNYTFLIEVDGVLFSYRIPGENSEVFIDRSIETKNIDIVKQLDLNCKNVFLNKINGQKMAEFLIGEDLTIVPFDYDEVAEKLHLLHDSGLKAVNDYDKIERLNYYEKLANNINDKYMKLKKQLIKYIEEYKNVEKVFCHGDAQKANWIKSDKLYLLDWEYSGNNDPYYDIACFGNVDFNDSMELLKSYLKREPSANDIKRLLVNRMFQCMQWYNVALYKEQIGLSNKLNIKFDLIAEKYLKLSKEFLINIEKINI